MIGTSSFSWNPKATSSAAGPSRYGPLGAGWTAKPRAFSAVSSRCNELFGSCGLGRELVECPPVAALAQQREHPQRSVDTFETVGHLSADSSR